MTILAELWQGARSLAYTQITWLICGFGLLIVEIIALVKGDPPLTDAMRQGSQRWMLWPALFGTMCGHFFGSSGSARFGPGVMIALGLVVLYRDLFVKDFLPPANHMEIFLLFLGLGAWLWGSR